MMPEKRVKPGSSSVEDGSGNQQQEEINGDIAGVVRGTAPEQQQQRDGGANNATAGGQPRHVVYIGDISGHNDDLHDSTTTTSIGLGNSPLPGAFHVHGPGYRAPGYYASSSSSNSSDVSNNGTLSSGEEVNAGTNLSSRTGGVTMAEQQQAGIEPSGNCSTARTMGGHHHSITSTDVSFETTSTLPSPLPLATRVISSELVESTEQIEERIRQQLLASTVLAHAVTEEEEENAISSATSSHLNYQQQQQEQNVRRKRKRQIAIILLVMVPIIVVIATALGATLSSRNNNSNGGPQVQTGATTTTTTNGQHHTDFSAGPTFMPSFTSTSPPPLLPFWTQLGQDIIGNVANDALGTSIALSEDGMTLAVGSVGSIFNDPTDGLYVHVYKYRSDETNSTNNVWVQMGQELEGSNNNDDFGRSVALSGDGRILAIGASQATDALQESRPGQVQVFQYNVSMDSWTEMGGSPIYGSNHGDWFGFSIALSKDGTTLVVGAPLYDTFNFEEGLLRVFHFNNATNNGGGDGGVWEQLGGDMNNYADYQTQLGYSVDISGDGWTVVGGAYRWQTGFAHAFVFNGTDWNRLGNILAGQAESDFFGISVALSGNGRTLAVGAALNDNPGGENAGHVRVFRYDNTSTQWRQLGKAIEGASPGEELGISVAINSDGTIVGIGAHEFATEQVRPGYAQVYLYNYENDTWTQLGSNLVGKDPLDFFGTSLALSSNGSIVAVGGPMAYFGANGNDKGHVRVFVSENE